MSPKERRAYRFGFLRAMRLARRDLHVMAARWDDQIAELTDEMQAAREQVIQHIDDELIGLADEMRGVRNEYRRLRAVEHAIDTERDPDTLLN